MQTAGIIDRVFNWSRVRHAQLAAPVLAEREQYLAYLLENGVSRPSVRSTACTLMHLVRLLDLHSMRAVHISEIEQASARWIVDPSAHVTRLVGPSPLKISHRWRAGGYDSTMPLSRTDQMIHSIRVSMSFLIPKGRNYFPPPRSEAVEQLYLTSSLG
jgi:hypothetical protein